MRTKRVAGAGNFENDCYVSMSSSRKINLLHPAAEDEISLNVCADVIKYTL